jgi:hypothetical protein
MSETALRVVPQDYAPPDTIDRMRSRALFIGLPFAVVSAVCAVLKPDLFLRSWLVSFMFWLGLTLGSLALLMLQYTSGGNWGRLGRRFWEAGTRTLPLIALFFIPIVVGMKHIYRWTDPDVAATLGSAKVALYLNPKFFILRAVIYFVGWGILAWRLGRWSQREEAGQTTPSQFVAIQNMSGFGIVFYGLSITFASIDWTMSLNPHWWSTVWGMLFMVGEVLSTFAFTIILLVRLAQVEPLSRMFKTDYLHDFGKLMFAFVVLWAYLSFSQWLIIWSGNMLVEIKWYLIRLRGGWQYFGPVLIFFHFVFPFALLLSRNLKRHGRRVVMIALLIMVMRFVDLFWQIVPNFYPGNEMGKMEWMEIAMYIVNPIAMGGLWLAFFFWQLGKRSLMPVNDPHFVEMLEAKHG